jgi:hypothetical protein
MIEMMYRSSFKVTVLFARFLKLGISLHIVLKIIQILKFMIIRPMGAALFHADGRKDRDGQADRHDEDNSRF